MKPRYLETVVAEDLTRKMVFVAGPRQVGKTTLGRRLLARAPAGAYYSWDNAEDRRLLRRPAWPTTEALVVLDEIHKLRGWKRWLKGEHDTHGGRVRFLVTGSARLDVYRRGGDSLQGRYHHFRLHPFSVAELLERPLPSALEPPAAPVSAKPLSSSTAGAATEALTRLFAYGGFPEPLLAASPRTLRRWHKERLERFLREDVRDLETVRDLSSLEHMAALLAERVGSPLSLNALREDLDASHRALTHWLEVFERLYHVFRVAPFVTRAVRALRKMPKVYLWDPSGLADEGARFENLVALHLLKFCHFLEDAEGRRVALHYLRDKAGHEVDFLVTADGMPWFAVEAKLTDRPPSRSLHYFRERMKIPHVYHVALDATRDVLLDGVRCMPASAFLAALA